MASNYLPQQTSIILSREVLNPALSDPNVLALPAMNATERQQGLLETLSAKVGKDDIITVSASSGDPNEPAVLVNAVVRAYIRWHATNRRVGTADLLTSLNEQQRQIGDELLTKRRELAGLAERANVSGDDQGSIVSKTLDLLKQEYATARLYAIQQESYCARLKALESDPNRVRQYILGQGMTADDRERVRLTNALYDARLKLREFSAGGTVQKSQITLYENTEKELVQRITELDRSFVGQQIEIAQALLEDAKRREDVYKKLYEDELAKLQTNSEDSSKYELKRTECEMLQSLYNTILNKINGLDLSAPLEGLSIHILERAEAGQKTPTQMARVMGMGLVLGFVLGGGFAFLRDMRDTRVRSADEITAILGVPILGAVPTIRRRGLLRRKPGSRLAPGSRESESFRAIRTALFFGPSRGGVKTLLVTSPGPLEGKTTLVCNLGIAMAHAGQKTLIIDADLRKPTQHRVFAAGGRGSGLVDVLLGTTTVEKAIRPTDVEGLDLLESGSTIANPSELLSGGTFASMLERLKTVYDRIVVDSPPVGIVSDAQILAARCGLTLLVLRAQRSSRVVTQHAREALSAVCATVVGAVVNDVAKGDTRYSHYGSGAYSNYHSDDRTRGRRAGQKELPPGDAPGPKNGAGEVGSKTQVQGGMGMERPAADGE
jgi:capsular exopolysaccharide synthesis family protein